MPPTAPTVASSRFSTEGMPQRERVNAVLRLRDRGLLPLEPLPDHAVHVQVTKCFLPGVSILSGALGGLSQKGDAQTTGVTDDVFFALNLAGRSTATQRQREITFGDGDAVVLCGADGNFSVTRPEPSRFVGLRVPRRHIAPLVAGLDDRTMQLIPNRAYPLRLLTSYLAAITDLQAAPPPETSRIFAAHVHDLIALSIGATPDAAAAAEGSVRAARLRAIKADVVAILADSVLSAAAVAARHRITRRYLHRLFEDEGTTFSRFVLEQRLVHAYRLLCDERFATRTITSIAYDAGFSDLSYFNRTFRRRFGATPSDLRAAPGTASPQFRRAEPSRE